MMDKGYEKPVFQHHLRVNKSLEKVKAEILDLRSLGYQVDTERNVYEDEIFKIRGFEGSVFEIEGQVRSRDDGTSEILYKTRLEKQREAKAWKAYILLMFFLLLAFLLHLSWNFANTYETVVIMIGLSLLFLLMIRVMNPYLPEIKKAAAALEKLEARLKQQILSNNLDETVLFEEFPSKQKPSQFYDSD
jgi:hypothetical protein